MASYKSKLARSGSYGQRPGEFSAALNAARTSGNTTFDCYWDGILVERSGYVGATPEDAKRAMLSLMSADFLKSRVAYLRALRSNSTPSPLRRRRYSLGFAGLRYNRAIPSFRVDITTLEVIAAARQRNAHDRTANL